MVAELHRGSTWLVANRRALAERDLGAALDPLLRLPGHARNGADAGPVSPAPLVLDGAVAPRGPALGRRTGRREAHSGSRYRTVTRSATRCGRWPRRVSPSEGYGDGDAVRRPGSAIEGLEVKVIRPQDVPQAVALGRFDLALTGRDWLAAHLAAFPGSPVVELCDLRRSRYRMGAVVSEDVPAETIAGAIAHWRREDPRRGDPGRLGVRRARRPVRTRAPARALPGDPDRGGVGRVRAGRRGDPDRGRGDRDHPCERTGSV